MSRGHASLVLGYHGCGRDIGLNALTGQQDLIPEARSYHWLGTGIYFWENDRQRAYEWAKQKESRGELKEPFVIGAIIALENCLDLQLRENIPIVESAYKEIVELKKSASEPLPINKPAPRDKRKDNVMRELDCAVINRVHQLAEEPFDTVRGLFVEGEPIYPGGHLYRQTHTEIAVVNPRSIIGLFLPR